MTADEKLVAKLIADGLPRHAILAELMSRGFREAEASELLARVAAASPAPVSPSGPKPTDMSIALPGLALGAALLVLGFVITFSTGRFPKWIFIFGGLTIAGALAKLASGS